MADSFQSASRTRLSLALQTHTDEKIILSADDAVGGNPICPAGKIIETLAKRFFLPNFFVRLKF